jgi:hypothetical protein
MLPVPLGRGFGERGSLIGVSHDMDGNYVIIRALTDHFVVSSPVPLMHLFLRDTFG